MSEYLYQGMGRYYRLIDPTQRLWLNRPIGAAATVDQHESQPESAALVPAPGFIAQL